MTRFTQDGSDELERKLKEVCEQASSRVRQLVPAHLLEGLLLGGGYGRGEGGVFRSPEGDRPYNDLEFYLLIQGNSRLNEKRFHPIHDIAHDLSALAGIEVEFKILSLARLKRSQATMFFYDLAVGHKRLIGPENLLDRCSHLGDASRIPLSEAVRLLMNRVSGLLFAQEKMELLNYSIADADFIYRNQAKAQLAFGDIVLAVHGLYHWSCMERHRRLSELVSNAPHLKRIVQHHQEGTEFKLHPSPPVVQAFQSRQQSLCEHGAHLWLWLENQRLQRHFENVSDYAFSPVNKCPETAAWKNVLVNLRCFGRGVLRHDDMDSYPRQRLLNSLPLLLWDRPQGDGRQLQWVQKELQTGARSFPDLVNAYRNLWSQFN